VRQRESCKHSKCNLGPAIEIRIPIGSTVHIDSKIKESPLNLDLVLAKILNPIKQTKTKISSNHTIIKSCSLSSNLELNLCKFKNLTLLQNGIKYFCATMIMWPFTILKGSF